MKNQNKLQLKQLTSLAKVFMDSINCSSLLAEKKCVKGQEFSYQIAYRCTREVYEVIPYGLKVEAEGGLDVSVFRVENVPSTLPYFRGDNRSDDDYITKKPGLFPDCLIPFDGEQIEVRTEFWSSLWVTVKVPQYCKQGIYNIVIKFTSEDGTLAAKRVLKVNVYPQVLPPQKLLMTQWLHCDCIADIHKVDIFSDCHWALIEQYMLLAANNGLNVIFTPVLTPPIDTAVGSERPTVQLADILKNGDKYSFGFNRLRKWIALAKKCGIDKFEINHFYTQWGAAHAAKVIAEEDGIKKRIFGWETDSTSEEYGNFLTQLIPALIAEFASAGVSRENLFFHISDEPLPVSEQMRAYAKASELIHPLIKGCSQFDALSHYEFYENGSVWEPIVASNNIQTFIDNKVPNLWVYYCSWQGNKVGNRFLAMPSYRNRILGVQMYKADVRGFLHWGYNFYYTALSRRTCDPYRETDSGGAFVSGDAFSVYPYKDGATPSLRLKVFFEGLQDMRLLYLAEERIGRAKVIEALDKMCGTSLTFENYPRSEKFYEQLHTFIFSYLQR